MERLKKIQSANIALVAFCAYLLKILIFKDASVEDGVVMAFLTGLYGYNMHLKSKQPVPINSQVIGEIEKMKAVIDSLKLEKSVNRKSVKYF